MAGRDRLAFAARALPRGTWPTIVAWLVLLAIFIVLLLPFRSTRNEGAIALALLIPPLVATGAGPRVAAFAAIVTGLAFNFFFTHPYDSPQIASPSSIAAFVVYLIVAVIVAIAIARTREARTLADRRAGDAILIQSVTVELLRNAQLVPTLRSALAQLVEETRLRGAALRLTVDGEPVSATAGDAGRSEQLAAQLADRGTPNLVTLRAEGQPAVFPLLATEGPVGVLVVDTASGRLEGDRERVVESVAGVIALAVERARLASEGIRRRALEETDRLRTTLLQSVSHDLRTPLTAIKANASALRGGGVEAPGGDRMLADIEDEADRLAHLVSNLLDLSRIDAGTLRLERVHVPIDDLVYSAIGAAALGGDEERIAIGIPADDSPVLDVDETLVRQVLVNLLSNAVRFAPGGPIEVDATVAGGRAEIRVRDHGPGIPEAERRRLFEPHYRARPGVRGAGPGAGLGLVISRAFADANGGSLTAEPTPGGGATFILELPLAP